MSYTPSDLDRLAWAIDADGVARHEADAAAVADLARDLGVVTSLLDVLVDSTTPAPVRERAFGVVAHAIARAAATPATSPEWALAN